MTPYRKMIATMPLRKGDVSSEPVCGWRRNHAPGREPAGRIAQTTSNENKLIAAAA